MVQTVEPPKGVPFDDEKNTRLHFAAARGRLEDVKAEIDAGHKVDPENYMGWTPLMMAARNGHNDVVDYLLKCRADATKKNGYGVSVLLMAVASGNRKISCDIVNHLLCGGVSRPSMESFLSPLSVAILFGHDELFRLLRNKQFSINPQSTHSELSPVMCAYLTNNNAIKEELLQNGALDIDQVTAKNMTSQINVIIPKSVEPEATKMEDKTFQKPKTLRTDVDDKPETAQVSAPLPVPSEAVTIQPTPCVQHAQYKPPPLQLQQVQQQQQLYPDQQVPQQQVVYHDSRQQLPVPAFVYPEQAQMSPYMPNPIMSYVMVSPIMHPCALRSPNVSTPASIVSPNFGYGASPVFFSDLPSPVPFITSSPSYIDYQNAFSYPVMHGYYVPNNSSQNSIFNRAFNGSDAFNNNGY